MPEDVHHIVFYKEREREREKIYMKTLKVFSIFIEGFSN